MLLRSRKRLANRKAELPPYKNRKCTRVIDIISTSTVRSSNTKENLVDLTQDENNENEYKSKLASPVFLKSSRRQEARLTRSISAKNRTYLHNTKVTTSPSASPDSRLHVIYCHHDFRLYIRRKDLVQLTTTSPRVLTVYKKNIKKKTSSTTAPTSLKQPSLEYALNCHHPSYTSNGQCTRCKYSFTSWLNATTIDAISMYQLNDQDTSKLHGMYIGSSFSVDSLKHASNSYLLYIQELIESNNRVIMVLNVGRHWVLLKFQKQETCCSSDGVKLHNSCIEHSNDDDNEESESELDAVDDTIDNNNKKRTKKCHNLRKTTMCTLYDPMASSSIDISIINFASKVCKCNVEFEDSMKGIAGKRFISVRTQLQNYNFSFFQLRNVGVQLSEGEGYNCGMYTALWTRYFIFEEERETDDVPCLSLQEINSYRVNWQQRLNNLS